jgi:hypothetical protein
MDLSHRPSTLYGASTEHLRIASELLESGRRGNYAMSIYIAGLGVECILQAIALHHGSRHDARHDLRAWLAKCPGTLISGLRGTPAWDEVVASWSNEIRYFSFEALAGYLRRKNRFTGRKGGVESLVRAAACSFVAACVRVQEKGVAEWLRSCRRK